MQRMSKYNKSNKLDALPHPPPRLKKKAIDYSVEEQESSSDSSQKKRKNPEVSGRMGKAQASKNQRIWQQGPSPSPTVNNITTAGNYRALEHNRGIPGNGWQNPPPPRMPPPAMMGQGFDPMRRMGTYGGYRGGPTPPLPPVGNVGRGPAPQDMTKIGRRSYEPFKNASPDEIKAALTQLLEWCPQGFNNSIQHSNAENLNQFSSFIVQHTAQMMSMWNWASTMEKDLKFYQNRKVELEKTIKRLEGEKLSQSKTKTTPISKLKDRFDSAQNKIAMAQASLKEVSKQEYDQTFRDGFNHYNKLLQRVLPKFDSKTDWANEYHKLVDLVLNLHDEENHPIAFNAITNEDVKDSSEEVDGDGYDDADDHYDDDNCDDDDDNGYDG